MRRGRMSDKLKKYLADKNGKSQPVDREAVNELKRRERNSSIAADQESDAEQEARGRATLSG